MLKLVLSLMSVFALEACATTATAADVEALAPLGTVVEFQGVDENDPDRSVYDSTLHAAGLPMVLDFYFAACPACNSNAGNVRQLASEFHGASAQVVEISIDDDAGEYDRWLARHPALFPVVNGSDRNLTRVLGVRSYPTTIVLNGNHEIVYRHVGLWTPATKARIRTLLQQQVLARGGG